ncbi:hypothetical protein B9Z19DRAFT_1130365 [Tuber borchii]|uniref:Uncharacterized protein n=1 Tax=Tuber borchii TaxID=42251 RepID=A0A2T6ZKR7_TUBBO|nr:hypothetical protein B9Z19DRAFT_1130365 [Tuber borchii]
MLCRRFANPRVISDTEYPPLVPGEKQSLLIKVDLGNPTALTVADIKARDPTNDWSAVERQINSIRADLGVYETPLLTVTLKYQHISNPLGTTLSISRTARSQNDEAFFANSAASASDGLVDSTQRKLSFASDPTDEVLAYWRDAELSSSPFVPP